MFLVYNKSDRNQSVQLGDVEITILAGAISPLLSNHKEWFEKQVWAEVRPFTKRPKPTRRQQRGRRKSK